MQSIAQHSFFVTGTDTDAGKTFISCALLHRASQLGYPTLGLKPIAAGCVQTEEGLRNDDALALQRYSSVKLDYSLVNPIALVPPIAPHIAAAKVGLSLDAKQLASHCRDTLSIKPSFAIVEGAGGWLVPLSDEQTMADLAVTLQLPVILVVGLKLGCINHSLLTVEAIKQSGLVLAGWVANQAEPDMSERSENIASLSRRISAPCIGIVPHIAKSSIEQAANSLDIGKLLPLSNL